MEAFFGTIHLVHGRDRRLGHMDVVMKFRLPQNAGNVLSI
jgi:hypothetical protein